MTVGLITGNDNKTRCWWCAPHGKPDELYTHYHDTEWGRPVTDDIRLFEKICLEGFQAGLSWITILRKRENFRAAFNGFDYHTIAKYDERDIERLLGNEGIIRHRGKVEATINNAARMIELIEAEGSLYGFVSRYTPQEQSRPNIIDYTAATTTLTQTPESIALSKALKKRGWKFVGPTTCYAFMQAMGLVNDHLHGCDFRNKMRA